MIVYQYDRAGLLVGPTEADESPLEPGVFLKPARTTETAPPSNVPDGYLPRWKGAGWELIAIPDAPQDNPVDKLAAFLAANPDVADLINNDGGANV